MLHARPVLKSRGGLEMQLSCAKGGPHDNNVRSRPDRVTTKRKVDFDDDQNVALTDTILVVPRKSMLWSGKRCDVSFHPPLTTMAWVKKFAPTLTFGGPLGAWQKNMTCSIGWSVDMQPPSSLVCACIICYAAAG